MDNANKDIRDIFKPSGMIFIVSFVIFLFLGFAAPYLAPQTFLGEAMESKSARVIYMVILISIYYAIEKIFNFFGIKFLKK